MPDRPRINEADSVSPPAKTVILVNAPQEAASVMSHPIEPFSFPPEWFIAQRAGA